MRNRPRIYNVMSPDARYVRAIYQGVTDYFSSKTQHYDLLVVYDHQFIDRKEPFQGIITVAATLAMEKAIKAYGVPAVNVSSYLESPTLPTVASNTVIGGKIAAEHLLDCKFHHFAYYGRKKGNANITLGHSFKQTIEAAGFQCAVHLWSSHKEQPARAFDPIQQKEIQKWITTLPKPVGIFSGNDPDAWAVWSACDALGLNIGKEIGIVGHDNDEFFCQTCHPQLSSVESRPDRIGYAAAELLDSLIGGAKPPKNSILIPPAGVVRRASSDVLMAEDPHVAMAIKFIRAHLDHPFKIEDVFNHVPLSRRTLQRRFHEYLGHTLEEAIQMLKIERIKHLLISTTMTIEEISDACSFSSASYLSRLFRQKVGTPPSEYRIRFQIRSPLTFRI